MDTNVFTIAQFAKKYTAFTEPSLRWLLFNREQNGLCKAVLQLGRRVYIDELAFVEVAAAADAC